MLAFWSPLQLPILLSNLLVVIKSGIRTQGEVGWRKSALNPPMVYSTDRSKAVVPVLILLFVALWFILRGHFFYVLFYVICSCVFQSF